MGVEPQGNGFSVDGAEEGFISDSEAFASVINVLDGVRMVRSNFSFFFFFANFYVRIIIKN